jgi:hypothetical protein
MMYNRFFSKFALELVPGLLKNVFFVFIQRQMQLKSICPGPTTVHMQSNQYDNYTESLMQNLNELRKVDLIDLRIIPYQSS